MSTLSVSQRDTWLTNMMRLVSTVRPDLDKEKRDKQRETLERAYEKIQDEMDPSLSPPWRRGLLFEHLTKSTPDYPVLTPRAAQVRDYLIDCLTFDLFMVRGLHHRLRQPDDFVIEVVGNTALVRVVIEIKLDPLHADVGEQLSRLLEHTTFVVERIDTFLVQGFDSPVSILDIRFPECFRRIEVSSEVEQHLYVPEDSSVSYQGWKPKFVPFTYKEVRVIATFLSEKELLVTPRK